MVFSKYNFSNTYFGAQDHSSSDGGIGAAEPYMFNKSGNSFLAKAGVQFTKNLAAFVSVQSSVSKTQEGYFELSSTAAQIGINYFFNF